MPSIPEKENRDKFFKIRLSQSEETELKEMAKSQKTDPSKLARSRIFTQNTKAA